MSEEESANVGKLAKDDDKTVTTDEHMTAHPTSRRKRLRTSSQELALEAPEAQNSNRRQLRSRTKSPVHSSTVVYSNAKGLIEAEDGYDSIDVVEETTAPSPEGQNDTQNSRRGRGRPRKNPPEPMSHDQQPEGTSIAGRPARSTRQGVTYYQDVEEYDSDLLEDAHWETYQDLSHEERQRFFAQKNQHQQDENNGFVRRSNRRSVRPERFTLGEDHEETTGVLKREGLRSRNGMNLLSQQHPLSESTDMASVGEYTPEPTSSRHRIDEDEDDSSLEIRRPSSNGRRSRALSKSIMNNDHARDDDEDEEDEFAEFRKDKEEEEDEEKERVPIYVGGKTLRPRRSNSRYAYSSYGNNNERRGRPSRSLRKKEPVNYAQQMYPQVFKEVDLIEQLDKSNMLPPPGVSRSSYNRPWSGHGRFGGAGAGNPNLFRLNEDEDDYKSPPPKGRLFALLRSGSNQQRNAAIHPLNMSELLEAQKASLLKNVDGPMRTLYEEKDKSFAAPQGIEFLLTTQKK